MKLYYLNKPKWDHDSNTGDPDYGKYATFAYYGTLDTSQACEECAIGTKAVEPLQVAWESGSDLIADVTWTSGSFHMLVREHVKLFMEERGFNCVFSDKLEHMHSEFLRKRQKHVKLPYTVPKLYWLRCEDFVSLDREHAHVRLRSVCPKCGSEDNALSWENNFIRKEEIGDKKIFKIRDYGRFECKMITEDAYNELLSQNFTNLKFMLGGETT